MSDKKFFHVVNLTDKTLTPCDPWEFSSEFQPNEKIRLDKEERQAFYRNPSTKWSFYTPIEPANPNQRISKDDNPPKWIKGFAADYDVEIPETRVNEAVEAMKIKPSWAEKSLGGKVRLVWILERPIHVDGYDHAVFIQQQAEKWLKLDMLPGLDTGAFHDPARLLCNGASWRTVGNGPIHDPDLQAFIVRSAHEFNFTPAQSGNDIPLEIVEKAIREKFPSFSWPEDFAIDSQGPSFWVEGSTSPLSAIIKAEGMITFSDHATKPFYSWADILGIEFVREFQTAATANATLGIYFDGKNWWRKIKGVYKACGEKEISNHFRVICKLSTKKDKSGESPVERAFNYLYNEARVDGAAPFLFRPEGLIDYMGNPVLNISSAKVTAPSASPGEYPFIKSFLARLFFNEEQYFRFLAWFKHFYQSGVDQRPRPGQAIFLLGPPGIGKGLLSHEIVGKAVGGFTDASTFLVEGDTFGSENFHKPLLCLDDDTPGGSVFTQEQFASRLKKAVANQEFKYHVKFQVPTMVEWSGRVLVTVNLDYTSTRIVIPLDNSNLDKVCIFRCTSDETIKSLFPERYALKALLHTELPYFLHDLIKWEPPAYVARDIRFGYASWQDPELLDQAHQTSKAAPFKEILLEELCNFFKNNPAEAVWKGTVTQLFRLFQSNPHNDGMLKRIDLTNINRFIENVAKEGLIQCTAETGDFKTRVWVFSRPALASLLGNSAAVTPSPQLPASVPIFTK